MRWNKAKTVLVMLVALGSFASGAKLPGPGTATMLPRFVLGSLGTISAVTATPATVNLTMNTPGSTFSGTATISWQQTNGSGGGSTWNVQVSASGSCLNIPLSAITATCTTATVSPNGGGGNAACLAAGNLSAPVTLASGKEGNATARTFTVNVTYSVIDSWKYQGGTCPISLVYLVSAP